MEVHSIIGAILLDADGDEIGEVEAVFVYEDHIALATSLIGVETEDNPEKRPASEVVLNVDFKNKANFKGHPDG
jgi:hypothetical protein